MTTPRRAVLLAAGRGTRMQDPDPSVALTPGQATAADAGLKMLVPLHGRPFLAYVLHELAEAGCREACLVVGPGDDPVRAAARALRTDRLRLRFAVQDSPLGTAHAVAAAADMVGHDPFLVINGDNLYPAALLARLLALDGPGLIGFDRAALVAGSNIPAERVAAYALLEEEDGWLTGIVEKPSPDTVQERPHARVSMSCWRFDRALLEACARATVSERGEREIPDAVVRAMAGGTRLRVVPAEAGVLDLSHRRDIPALEARLAGRPVRL